MTVALAFFTRDLRVHDNPVLHAAARSADQVLPLFVLDERILASSYNRPNRARFLADSLAELDTQLRGLGGALVVRRGDVATEVARLAQEVDASHVHMATDVSGYAQARQGKLSQGLGRRTLVTHDSVTVMAPGSITPNGRDHFAVFTPYLRHWEKQPTRALLPPPTSLTLPPRVHRGTVPRQADIRAGSISPDLPPGGEQQARRRMHAWLDGGVARYHELHDDLAADGTSRLSPYLHFGCLSATELAYRAAEHGGAGADSFVRQLAWRDFHHQVLAARPHAAYQDYRTRHDRWLTDEHAFDAWRAGRTGYPVVDAGMRQLRREGYLHNRARLIVASFLVKTLYLDWRLGARHFCELLIDGDIANNAMNWQWVAGTGTDTRPNRVFNPLRQADRLDPHGTYVRRYLPELSAVDGPAVHRPWQLPEQQRRTLDYPNPIVDLREAAEHFRQARAR